MTDCRARFKYVQFKINKMDFARNMVKSVDNKSKSTSHVEFLAVGGHMLFMEKLLLCHWLEFFRGGFALVTFF